MARNTLSRSLHDIGLAAWFGGSLMGAIGVNGAASDVDDPRQRARVASAGWARWTPVNAAAIGAHLVGSLGQLAGNRDRLQIQEGVASMAIVKTALTAAALGATAYSRALGKKVSEQRDVPTQSGTQPSSATPADVAKAQKQLAMLQWAVPALTGALVVVTSFAGEQQRAAEMHKGIAARLLS